MDTIGTRLRHAMDQKGYSVDDLVRRRVMSRAGVYQWMSDTVKPDKVRAATVTKVCRVLGINRDWLLHGRGPMADSATDQDAAEAQAEALKTLQQDVHALRLTLSAMAAVMVSHRPAEAADLVKALKKLPEDYSQKGLAKALAEVLEPAVERRRGTARPSSGNP